MIEMSLQSLRRKKGRSLLTILAMCIGIAAVVTVSAAGEGMQSFVMGQLDAFGPDTLYVETKVPSVKHGADFGAVGITITTLRDTDIETIEDHSNIVTAYGGVQGQELVSYNGQVKKIMLMGRGATAPEVEKLPLVAGRFFTETEDVSLAQVVVLGAGAKEDLFGEDDAVGKHVSIRGKSFRVVGVLDRLGSAFFLDLDSVMMLPTKTMQKRLLGVDYVTSITAKFANTNASEDTVAELTEAIRVNHGIGDPTRDDFQIHTTVEAQAMMQSVIRGVTLLLSALVTISLVVGGVGIMNIMYVSVAERTFEIGLRKAVGANRRDILWQFLTEAILLTTSGGILGILIGAIFALLVYGVANAFGFTWVYHISLASVVLSVGFSAAIGLFFGLYPARHAASLNPIEALRRE